MNTLKNFTPKDIWLFVLVGFFSALIYLFEHSTTVKLTFQAHEKTKKLSQISESVERLRVKEVALSSAKRIYRVTTPLNPVRK
ncbi:hypothetical protein KAW50_02450 [candidate division WOR-3 bacterium]|nr:hypothetical protein [candidate division WOR-3 bacterium]